METYKAQGVCTNCGRKNYPQWGEYKVGTKITDYPCPNCNCMTWILDTFSGREEVAGTNSKT